MAFLANCWFLVESFIIPEGFLKWSYLSFYINPFFLFCCQIFLWLILLNRWISVLVFSLVRIISTVGFCVFTLLKYCSIRFYSYITRSTKVRVIEESDSFVLQNSTHSQIVHLYVNRQIMCKVLEVEEYASIEEKGSEDDAVDHAVDQGISKDENSLTLEDVDSHQDVSSSSCDSSLVADNALEMEGFLEPSCSLNLPAAKEKEVTDDQFRMENSDPFYKEYLVRMRWFDVLNYDRTYGISAILNKQLGSSVEFSIPMPWNKMARKRLLRSLESDYELIYVGQVCLSWEALHHLYETVEALGCSASLERIFFNKNIAGGFQKFQVLLERFMEDERREEKRVWNYLQGRFLLKSLLQVPEVSVLEGILEEEKKEATNGKQVLKVIEECIKTFWKFVQTDKKIWWKFSSPLWTNSPVEDPRDLVLFANLTRSLQKKEILLKDLQGKKRCWAKRLVVNPCQGKEILFRMIEMKIV